MKVKATKRGFDGTSVREENEEFEMPDGSKGSWFKPVGGRKQDEVGDKKPAGEGEKKPAG